MATGPDISQPLTLMERDGLQTTAHTSLEGNVVVPEGGSFMESSSIAKVAVEETCKEQGTYQTEALSFQAEKEMPENENEIVEGTAAKENEVVDKTKGREEKSEKNSEVVDNTETIPQTAKIEEPCLNIGGEESSKEEKILEHVEEDLNRQSSVDEERPGSVDKVIHGSERNEDEGRKIDQSDELQTSEESICNSSLHQSQEAFQTADAAVNNIDSGVETETEAFPENESKDNSRGEKIMSVDEKHIGEERFEGVEEKPESSSSFLDEKKGLDATKPMENIENEKEDTECHAIREGSSFLKESLGIQNGEEAISKVGEHVQDKLDRPFITESTDCIQEDDFEGGDKLEQDASMTCKEARQETINLSENMEDMIHVVNKTQEKLPTDIPSVTKTEEVEAQKVDESELHIVSETGLEDIVKKSPQQEGKTLTLEKTDKAGGIGGENVDEMNPKEKVNGLIEKNEGSKQSILQELATTEASTGDSREIGENTVIAEASADDSRDSGEKTVLAAEDNVNYEVPITTREHSEIAATTETTAEESRETVENTVIAAKDDLSDAVPITTAENSVIAAEEKIRDAITTIAPGNSKEETSKHDNDQQDSSTLQDELGKEEIENSLNIIPKEIHTTLSESSEAILSAKEDPATKIQEESSGDKREGEPVDTGTIIDNVIPKEKDLPSKESDENIEGTEVEIQSKNSNDLHMTHSLEQETIRAEDENLQKVSSFGPQEQFQDSNGASEDLEKHVAKAAAEVLESTENIIDLPSVEEATITELIAKPSERDIKKMEEVHDLEPEEKLKIDDAGTKIEEEMQNKEEVQDIKTHKQATTSERNEEVITDEVCNPAPVDEKVELFIQAENLQEAETQLRSEIEDNYKSNIVNEEAHDEPKVTGIGEVTDEETIKDNDALLALEDIDEKIVETSQDTGKEAEKSKGEEAEDKIMGEGNSEAILQESIKEAPVVDFQHDEQNSEISAREISAEFVAAKTIETEKNDGSHNSIPQTSPTKEQESLQAESQKPAEEEINEVGSPIRNDKDNNSGLAEVEENNSKETLKGGEDLEQTSQLSEADVLSKVTDNTEEEAADIVETNMMEEEVVKEDIKEQIMDESNMKSISQEYVDQCPLYNLQTDRKDTETSNKEIFEESKTSGTDMSIAHETDQIAESPSMATLVNEVESVDGEEIEKSDKESSKTIDGTDHETNQNSEIPRATLETLQVKEQESLQTEHFTPAETSPVDKNNEDGSIKKDENSEETLNGEENLEQILPNNKSEKTPEQLVTVISAEIETATFIKTAEHQDSMVDMPQGNTKEEEMTKEDDTDGQNIESNIKTVSQECVEEYPVENFQHDEKNHEKSNIEIFEKSQIAGGGESTAHEPRQNDESPKSSLSIPLVKEEESSKDEVENVTPTDASIREKEEDGILEKAGEGNDSNPEIIDINENSKREMLKVEKNLEQESQQKGETGEIEQSLVVMAAETEASPVSDEMDDITSTKEVSSIQNIDRTVEKENKEERENIDAIEVKKGNLEEDLKLVAEASDISKNNEVEVENLITGQKEVEMLEKKFVLDTKQEVEGTEAGENIEGQTKNEDIKEDATIASSSEDIKKHIKAEEYTGIDISPQATGDETDLISKEDEMEAKTEKEICEELVISSVDEDTRKQVSDEESNMNDQSTGPTGDFVYEDDQSGTLPKQEVHEITQIVEEVDDTGNQGNKSTTNFEVPLMREYEQNPVNLEKNHESTKMKLKEEVVDLDLKSTEQNEEQDYVEKQEFETLKDTQEPSSSLYRMEASDEEAILKERNESLVESPCLEPVNTEENLEETKTEVKDSSPVSLDGQTSETILREGEPEDKIQIESFQLASQEKGPVTMDAEGTTDEIVNVDAKSEDASNSGEIKDHGIPAAAGKPEKIEHEMQAETPTIGISEDQIPETAIEKHLGKNFDDKLHDSRESELMDNEASKTTDENPPIKENLETPGIPQEKEPVVKEDASKVGEMDTERESTNEEARSYQFEDLNKQQELDNEKHMFEDKEILKTEEASDLVNQEEILENEDSIKPGDETLKSIESISKDRKEAILEDKESSEKYNSAMTESVEVEKAAFELEAGTNDQQQAIDGKNYEVLAEENLELAESGKKPEHVSETGKVEDMIEIQNESAESGKKISQEFPEVQQQKEEDPELKLETEDHMKEAQTTDETIKDVISTEEVHEEIKKADSNEAVQCKKEEEKDIRELYATPAEDEVKESNLVATEYLKATDSDERTATVSSEVPGEPNMEEAAVAKEKEEAKVEDEDTRISAAVSITATAEEQEETKKIIDKEDSCSDKINATTVVEIAAETGLEETQLDEKTAQISNNASNDTISQATEAEASQQDKIGDGLALEEHSSSLASQLPTDDGKNVTNERVAPENVDADAVQRSKMASDVADEMTDHSTDELHTSNIKEINDASEIVKPPGAEGAAEQEVAADQTLPEVISEQHEHGTPAMTETNDGNIKDNEVMEDDPRTTEEISLQEEDPMEPDISQLKFQSSEDIKNQHPKEVQEEEFGSPDHIKEEIKEVSEAVSDSNYQSSEVQKEDETTSGQTALTENSEEQNQTSSVALFSNEKDCEITTTIQNIEEHIKDVEVPVADHPQDSASPVTTEDTCLHKDETKELEVSGLRVELNTDIQKDSLNEVPVEEGQTLDEASKLQPQEYKDKIEDREFVPESEKKTEITGALHETSEEAFESASEFHSNKSSAETEETETVEKHRDVAIIDLVAEENQNEKTNYATEIIHDEVSGEFERTFNPRTEASEEPFKSVSEIHRPEALAESEDTEIKENHPDVAAIDLAVNENQNERTIDANEIIHRSEKEKQQIMTEEEDANNCHPIALGEETSQHEYEHKAEESIGDESTVKGIQNEELYKEVEKADGRERNETHQDKETERSIEHLHQDIPRIEIQDESSEAVEKISQEFQKVQQEKEENPELKLETKDHMKETQTTDETIKDVILTEEVHEEIKRADSNEAVQCKKEEEKDIRELYATPAEDEVKESNLVATEYLKATDSDERTATVSSEVPGEPNMEEAAVAKEKEEAKVEDEDTRISAAVSTTATAEEQEETKKIIDKEDSCSDKINATTVVEIAAETGLEETQLDEKPAQISNNASNDTISQATEAEASQQDKIGDGLALEEHSSLASQLPTDNGKNVTNERVAPENADADDVQGRKMASDVADEMKDHSTDELHTSNIKEINDASEMVKPPGAEGAAEQEVAADQALPEVISEQHEHETPAMTETNDGNIKDNEVMEDDPRTTEEISLQEEDPMEPDISQVKLQSSEDIQNQHPKEVQEEEFGSPDDIKGEIKEVSESVSNSNSQSSEVQKEDETTSGQIALTEHSEEQNQTSAVALFSNEKDCEITTTIQNIEEHIKDVEVPVADHPQDSASPVTTEDTCLHKDETKELEVSGLRVELNTDIQKDSLNEVPVEEGQTLDEASKLQPQEYKEIEDREFVPESEKKTEITGALHETSEEAFESASEFHSNKSSAETEETETVEKYPEVAIIDLVAEENQNEKTNDATEITHDEVSGEFEQTFNPRTETSEEAFKSVSEIHGPEALAESEDTEIKENHPEVAASDLVADENQNERTIDANEIRHRSEKERQQIMAEEEDANNCHPITLGEETSQHEYEHKDEESIGDESTVKEIQNEELYKEVEKADGRERNETHQDKETERSIEHLHQDIFDNETIKERFPEAKNGQEAGSKTHLENQNNETTFGNGRAEAVTINEEELNEEMSRKDGPTDPAEASKTTQAIHQGEKASETTTQNIEEHVKEENIAIDEHPQSSSAPKTTEDKSSEVEETKELKVTGLEVELDTDLQKDITNDVLEQEGRTPEIASASQPQEYEKDVKDAPAGDKMKEITIEELVKSVSKVHGHEILTKPEDTEIQEKHPEVAVNDLAQEENQSNKTREATEIIHDEFTDEEVTTTEKEKIMEENGDARTYYPLTSGEEKTEGSHQIYERKAEESEGHKTPEDIQTEEVINERKSEYLHQDAAETETIKMSLPDEAAVKNVEDIGTKLHLEKQSDETISGCGGTEATDIKKEELGIEMSEKEGPTGLAKANETTQEIHEVQKSSESNSEGQISSEAEYLETTGRKKDVPQVLQEPIAETKQSGEAGESQPGNAIEVVNTQGLEHETDKGIDENNGKEIEAIMSAESAKTSLFDMMQRSTRDRQVAKDLTEEKAEAIASKDETKVETNKAKSGEENEKEEDGGEEHRQNDSGSDAPVMVEASRDIVDTKVIPHKKSHNILSGVGSKVKHSISKVKKAITGKSSHPKQHSPK